MFEECGKLDGNLMNSADGIWGVGHDNDEQETQAAEK